MDRKSLRIGRMLSLALSHLFSHSARLSPRLSPFKSCERSVARTVVFTTHLLLEIHRFTSFDACASLSTLTRGFRTMTKLRANCQPKKDGDPFVFRFVVFFIFPKKKSFRQKYKHSPWFILTRQSCMFLFLTSPPSLAKSQHRTRPPPPASSL